MKKPDPVPRPRAPKRRKVSSEPLWVGGGLTLAVFLIAVWAGFGEVCQDGVCTPKWKVFLNSTPAEIGDALSGVGSVLAFIWVIVTVWMQSIELRLQRAEMREQQAETAKMAEAMAQQSRIFEQEQIERAEDRADKELDALIDRFLTAVGYIKHWVVERGRLVRFGPQQNEAERFDHAMTLISSAREELDDLQNPTLKPMQRAVDPDDAILAAKYLRQINEIRPRLSPASQIWLTKFEIEKTLQSLDYLLAQKQLWTKPVEGGTP
ncbi:hypothetical protein [Paracoccus sulfuroxidans]|uniref:Uncharacterized protein n=1 Tax=Paracoccus sulfuroxidans TaxID=384678 RepID=A0A562NXB8_9RHOB|nr:hypothetical protein [Paracoccus sulfuroxidans]TWI36805.1 hypothetical protein IQ24_00588 [Paracoccus sulfuroxidans]